MHGRLTAEGTLSGRVSVVGGVHGSVSADGGLHGSVSTVGGLHGRVTAEQTLTGSVGTPVYSGSYTVAPGETLPTAGKLMEQDVTGADVPQGSVSVADVSVSTPVELSVSSGGLVTGSATGTGIAVATVEEGYVSEGAQGIVTAGGTGSMQLPTLGAQTLEAGDSIDPGVWLTGRQTILPWSFMGTGVTKVEDVFDSGEVALEDTLFASWTPSTTAKAIVATKNVGTFTAHMTTNEYILKWIFEFDNAWNSGATLKVTPIKQVVEIYTGIFRRPSNLANLTSGTFNGNATATIYTAPIIKYYNGSGVQTLAYTASYGIYPAATAPTLSSSTAASPTVTIKMPTVNARCSTTYMSTARAAEIDQANAKYRLRGELWQMDIPGSLRSMYEDLVRTYNGN